MKFPKFPFLLAIFTIAFSNTACLAHSGDAEETEIKEELRESGAAIGAGAKTIWHGTVEVIYGVGDGLKAGAKAADKGARNCESNPECREQMKRAFGTDGSGN